jgi:hypothetical protein
MTLSLRFLALYDVASRLEILDEALYEFVVANHLVVGKNQGQRPCRVVRKPGNPIQVFELELDREQVEMGSGAGLPYNVGLAAYYYPDERHRVERHVPEWRVGTSLLELVGGLPALLAEAFELLDSWGTPQLVLGLPPQGWVSAEVPTREEIARRLVPAVQATEGDHA